MPEEKRELTREIGSQSHHEEKHWLDYLEAAMGGIGLVVLVVYTSYTALMYSANKRAADAATSAAKSAEDSVTSPGGQQHDIPKARPTTADEMAPGVCAAAAVKRRA